MILRKLFARFINGGADYSRGLPEGCTIEMLEALRRQVREHERQPMTDLPLNDMRFIVFDTETTGFDAFAGDEIISLSAVVVQGGRLKQGEFFDQLINPWREIPEPISRLTGITADQVTCAPGLFEILPEFLRFVGQDVMVAHPAPFDLNFINVKLRRFCGCSLKNHVIDMLDAAHCLFTRQTDLSLEWLANHYSIPVENRHSSLGDALLAAKIWCSMIEDLEKKGITTLYSFNRYIKNIYKK